MTEIAIKAVGVTRWFGEGEAQTFAVRDVTFEAHFHEMLYIVGPSGSGKTTLLSMISGILRPTAGDVFLEGIDVWRLRRTRSPTCACTSSGSCSRTITCSRTSARSRTSRCR